VSVALDASNQSYVRVCIHENFHIAQIADALVDEEKDSVDDDDIGRLDTGRSIAPR